VEYIKTLQVVSSQRSQTNKQKGEEVKCPNGGWSERFQTNDTIRVRSSE